ncbi:DNA methyltransferase [Laspinema palackyanum]|uniref:DNA methyltransferase n=1 Tax=Laspinema palackyanum TaxID=3231601 RepID=UPI00345CA5A4|nr:site-specific DNA-methyltransferase [Laspinema sp. D2c]
MMACLVTYANQYGKPTNWPYFSIDGKSPVTAAQWSRMRAKWNHSHGVTNVWSEPAVRGAERLKNKQARCIHANQKPLRLIERIILASSDSNDVVWEPFGGLCSAAVAAMRKGRRCYSAEINSDYYELAKNRLEQEYDIRSSALFPELV